MIPVPVHPFDQSESVPMLLAASLFLGEREASAVPIFVRKPSDRASMNLETGNVATTNPFG